MNNVSEDDVEEEFTGRSLLLLETTMTAGGFDNIKTHLAPLVDPAAAFFEDKRIPDPGWRYFPRYQTGVAPVSPRKLSLREHAFLGILAIEPERYLRNPGFAHTTANEFPQVLDQPYRRLGVRTARATGSGIRVAIIDSGIADHSVLAGRIVDPVLDRKAFVTTNGVELEHGTLCAGIVCAPRTYYGQNGFGVAPGIRLFDAQVMANINSVADGTIESAIEWADVEKHADIIVFAASSKTTTGPNPIFERIGRTLLDNDRLLIAAAGRASAGAGTAGVEHPANCQSIVAVNSVDNGFRPMTSSVGLLPASDFVDFAAIADALPSTSIPSSGTDRYGTIDGTSAATAFAAGVAALWAQQIPGARGRALWAALMEHAVHAPVGSSFRIIGSGVLKAPTSPLP